MILRQAIAGLAGFFWLCACSDAGQTDDKSVTEGPPVGLEQYAFEDPERLNWSGTAPRPLITMIWYPAVEDSEMGPVNIPAEKPIFLGGLASRGAALAPADEKRPLVLLSHGTGGSGFQMMWLGRALAEEGYIAVAVHHHGNTAAEDEFDPRGFRLPWERAVDLSRVLDEILADEKFGPAIDESRIYAAGFSLGGYTVTALAGGQTDLEKFEAFCTSTARDTTCEEQSEFPDAGKQFAELLKTDPALPALLQRSKENYGDPRFSKIVALAPALGQAFTEESLAGIKTPMLFLAGEGDEVAPVATNADYLASHIPSASVKHIPKAGHYVFLNECSARGQRFVPVCKDPRGIDRAELHKEATRMVLGCFEGALCPAIEEGG